MIKVVHVDDQPRQLTIVKKLLAEFDEIDLVGQFTVAEEALQFLSEQKVDLLILDVEMPGKDGIWLANSIRKMNIQIVFLTAHSEYAVKAFEICALNYLLKPVTRDDLKSTIERLYQNNRYVNHDESESLLNQQINDLINNFLKKEEFPKRIFISNLKKTSVVNLDEVMYLTASGPYTSIKVSDGKRMTASKILKVYADLVEHHPDFVRIHRAHVVNKRYVKEIIREKHNVDLLMHDGERLQVSPQKREEITDLLML
jgi:two-component system LytT family response regulator